MMIRITMKEVEKGGVIIRLLSQENMRDTLSLGRVKVKSHIKNEFVPRLLHLRSIRYKSNNYTGTATVIK